ncbi:E3 ubiquitin-protein ligase MBR1 [Sesamum angolense]|uniref:RING-type E3 ubiquitin transferase n=1 Tax=Sesamum angolense TaxID=2727404 RepID=A0AAE1WF82_9LAMI|nr:E3 ubiquitin-protein ligase MBR1 [Sesamum angolense]
MPSLSSLFPADSTVGSRLLSKLVVTGQPAMGHRHMFNTPLIHETDADEGWNHAEQPYMPMGQSVNNRDYGSIKLTLQLCSQGLVFLEAVLLFILWRIRPSKVDPQLPCGTLLLGRVDTLHPLLMCNCHIIKPQVPTPSHDPFPHQPPGGNFYMVPDAYSHHPSSSSLSGQTVPGVDFYNQTMGSGRGPYKRKSPGSTLPYDRGTTSRYYDVGSSSNQYLPADGLQEKRSTESHHIPWEYPLVTELIASLLVVKGSNPPRREWDSSLVAGHVVNCDTEWGYSNNAISNGNPVPQNANNHQSVRGVRSGYCQTSVPSFGSSSSNFHSGQVGASDEGLQMYAESYLSRHPRVFSTTRLRNGERIGRAGILRDRYRSFTEEASLRDRLTSEGLMVADHPTFYESRTLFDLHREMRLDVDNMSYEELLVLGERIGSVSTGLSDGLISKCLTESIYCSSDQSQDDGKCVICLEEYKNMDDVGTLKCGHDFHVGCIRKWLSMKNLCPICKATAMDDGVKEKSSA